MSSLYCGFALCEVDQDGIVSLPEFLEEALGADKDGAELLISTHESDCCLVGYDHGHLIEIKARTQRWREADEAAGRDGRMHHQRSRHYFGMVERARSDSGRICLPAAMRRIGRIDGQALFVGTGDRFEIWNPELALAADDAALREIAAWRPPAPPRRRPSRSGTRRARKS